MTDKNTITSIPPLIAALEEAAERKGINKQELASALGVTYGYLAQLKSGIRETRNIGDEFADNCATFLGVPRIKVLIRAGRVRASDFYDVAGEEAFRLKVSAALKIIKMDIEWGPYFPYQLLEPNADPMIQQFVVLLYEKASNKMLLGEKVSAQEWAATLEAARSHPEPVDLAPEAAPKSRRSRQA